MASADWEVLRNEQIAVYNKVNLNVVTSATEGDTVDMMLADSISVFVNVSVNTGAVTVNIEASYDGTTWFELNSTTYTATTAKDIRSYVDHFPYMRTTTTTQSNSTVTTYITSRT